MKVAIEELSKVEIITKEAKVAEHTKEFGKFGITGMTVYDAMGCGVQLGTQEYEAEKNSAPQLLSKQVVKVVLPSREVYSFLEFVEKGHAFQRGFVKRSGLCVVGDGVEHVFVQRSGDLLSFHKAGDLKGSLYCFVFHSIYRAPNAVFQPGA